MQLIVLSGVTNSGKTTILDKLYTRLNKNKEFRIQFERGTSNENGNSVNDHRVLFRGKDKDKKDINVVITSQGDNTDELALNVLFFIESSLRCKEKDIDYWILSENTKYNNVKKSFEILCEKIKNHQFKNIINYSKVTTNKKERKDKSGQKDDNKQCLKDILEKLNIKEINDEVL